MIIKTLSLRNFRNYEDREFKFSPKTTLIVGPNTAGKTNILEAIYLLATGKSLRVNYDKELIQLESPLSYVSCRLFHSNNQLSLELVITSDEKYANLSRKRFKVNGISRQMSKFIGNLSAVMFSPEDIELVTDSPSLRRKYLDSILVQVDQDYRRAASDYAKVLRRRNKVLEGMREKRFPPPRHSELVSESGRLGSSTRVKMLKQVQHDDGGLEFWDGRLLEMGELVQRSRKEFFGFLEKKLPGISQMLLNGDQTFRLQYEPNIISESRLGKYRDREIAAAKTLVGPHRDEFQFFLNDRNLSSFGSRGEQRTAVLALKMAELDFIREKIGASPTLLLDDIFSELDERHRRRVLDLLGKQQTILTTTDAGLVGEKLGEMEVINLS